MMKWIDTTNSGENTAAASDALERCELRLKECDAILDPLEERLSNTPKPSVELGWDRIEVRDEDKRIYKKH